MWKKVYFKISQHNIQEDYVQRHKFQWAVCLPDTCHYEDVQKIVSNVLIPEIKHYGMEANVTIDPLLHTSNRNTYKYTAGFYIVWYDTTSNIILVYLQINFKKTKHYHTKIKTNFKIMLNDQVILIYEVKF